MNGQVNCPACGTLNTDDSKFCKSCASAIPTTVMQRDAIEPEATPMQPLTGTSTSIPQLPLPTAATTKDTNSTNGAAILPANVSSFRKRIIVAFCCMVMVGSIGGFIAEPGLLSLVISSVFFLVGLIVLIQIPHLKSRAKRLAFKSIDSTLPYQDIVKDIDTQFLSRGWNVKFRTQDQLVYEQRRHGRVWLAILLGLFAIIGGILYYFLSDRRESVIFQLTPLPENQGTRIEINLQDCKGWGSQKFALSVMENLSNTKRASEDVG